MTDGEFEEIKALVMEQVRVLTDEVRRVQKIGNSGLTQAEVDSLERAYDYDNT